MATDNQYVGRNSLAYIWKQITSKFVKKESFNEKIEEIQDSIVGLANADEVYIMSEGETEEDIPDNAVVVVYPDEDAEEIDWTNYYNKKEINEIITKAEFKRGDSAYQVAVKNGFEGNEEEWLKTLIGKSAYEIACELGFSGTQAEWLESLKPKKGEDYFDGKDGFTPTVTIEEVIVNEKKEAINIKVIGINGETVSTIDLKELENRLSAYAQNFIDLSVAQLVGDAPETLRTLGQLSDALNDNEDFANDVIALINNKVEKDGNKVLSTNDYTTAEKEKLAELAGKELLTKTEIEAMFTAFEQKIASEYLGNYKWRVSNDASTGYVTVKKKG